MSKNLFVKCSKRPDVPSLGQKIGFQNIGVSAYRWPYRTTSVLNSLKIYKISKMNHSKLPMPTHIRYPLYVFAGKMIQIRLIKLKETVNKKDDTGNTPLHYAVKYNSLKVVKILLENGARLDIWNNDGDLPHTQSLSCMDPVYCCYDFGYPEICVANKACKFLIF